MARTHCIFARIQSLLQYVTNHGLLDTYDYITNKLHCALPETHFTNEATNQHL